MTTAVRKMLALTARKKVVQGSTSSGKTYGIIPILYDKALETPRLRVTITAETLPALKEGCIPIFKNFLQEEGRWKDSAWNGTDLIYTVPSTQSKIQFKSYDTVGKAKAGGKRDVLFMNEANHMDYEIAFALMIRSKEIWMDFNADRRFWAHTEVLTEPNSEFLKLTYRDNEAIPPETLEDLFAARAKAFHDPELPEAMLFEEGNIKSKWWANWWKVYGMGEAGQLVGSVFENWEVLGSIPADAKRICTGVDFGYSISKFASVDVYKWNDHYILDELVYDNSLDNEQAANAMHEAGYQKGTVAYCDYAEPKSIAELCKYKIRAVPCESKTDIKAFAIKKLNGKLFYITQRSVNAINEFEKAVWNTQTGKIAKSDEDHLIDAALYAIGSEGMYNGKYYN